MSEERPDRLSAKAPIAIGALLLAIMFLLLYLSNQDGQTRFDAAKSRLEKVEQLNIQLDSAVIPVMLGYRADFDALTDNERRLLLAVADLDAYLQTPGSKTIKDLVWQKVRLVEDFKTFQALLAASKAAASVTLKDLWTQASPLPGNDPTQARLFAVERDFLDYIGRPNGHRATALRTVMQNIEGTQVAALGLWPNFVTQVDNLLDATTRSTEQVQKVFSEAVPNAFDAETARLQSQLKTAEKSADHYRLALFFVAVLLLVFGGAKFVQARSYMHTIERTNQELDDRVKKRTRELSALNESLVKEIMERERIESQLHIAQRLESIGQLAAGVAHEINTPIQYVSDNVAFLATVWRDMAPLLDVYERHLGSMGKQSGVGEAAVVDPVFLRQEVPAALEQTAYGLRQIAQIVVAMRSLSHPGGGELKEADLNKAIEMTAVVARTEWRNIAELVLKLDPALPRIACDVTAINQVILNLIVNAAQAIEDEAERREPGCIVVATGEGENYAEISIEDDGPGVPDAIRYRIFDPFFTTKDVGRGTGQGLALAYRVVTQQHSGTLTLAPSQRGKGARFVIRLPLALPMRNSTS